ncbi:MAG: RNA polymerase sigma-70 factor [Bacteroidetes bacterium]|nr:RNA polymerase sigma-70 factor [Bacteroidota bacterium]
MKQLIENQTNIEDGIRKGSLITFEQLFNDYYNYLCYVAIEFVKEKQVAEEIVSDVFFALWEKRESIIINTSLSAYLIRAVKNRCINYDLHSKAEQRFKQKIAERMIQNSLVEEYPMGGLLTNELTSLIKKSIDSLPEQCRQVFLLSRDEELKYDEIAERLNVSVNTVKTHMKIALSKLRVSLKDYLVFIISFFMFFK